MLLSHVCEFIYLKARKTARTPVEIYFEPCCVDPKNYSGERHGRGSEVSEMSEIGYLRNRRIEQGSPCTTTCRLKRSANWRGARFGTAIISSA